MPRCGSYRDYMAKLAGARALICTDTSAYHVAAAWDTPSCVVFGSTRIVQDGYEEIHHVEASQRVRYYPNAHAIQLPVGQMFSPSSDAVILQKIAAWLLSV